MINKINLSKYYYFIVYVGYVLTLFVAGMRPGVLAAFLMLVFVTDVKIGKIFSYGNVNNATDIDSNNKNGLSKGQLFFDGAKGLVRSLNLVDYVVFIYFLYNIFSVIWLTKYGYPVSVFADEFVSSVLPIAFYFIARWTADEKEEFYKWFLYAFLFLSVVSILLYLIAPQFYCDYLFNWSYISKADAPTVRVRMESVTGSTALSYLGVAAMCVSSYFVFKKSDINSNSAKIFGKIEKSRIFPIIMFVLSFVVVFMANGRAGMVAALLVVLFLNYIVIFKLKLISKKYFYAEVILVVVGIVALFIVTPSIASKIMARLVSLPGAVGQRSEQWIAAANNMKGAWLGNGLGANGHRAIGIENAHVVADGGLVKLFCEEGSVGFGLFTYVMFTIFIKGYKKIDKIFAEIAVIATALLMSIGSNIIAFQLCTPIFWYAIGSTVYSIYEE